MNPTDVSDLPSTEVKVPTFRQAAAFWWKLGLISFGGPAGQIAIMHEELVARRRWMNEARFLHALNFCMLLPGPEAQQLAIYSGWLLHGRRGGLVAGTLFVLPAAVLLWILSAVYVHFGNLSAIAGVLYGLKPAVTAIVAAAVYKIGQRILKNGVMAALALLAFAALFWGYCPFPILILFAGAIGFFGAKWAPQYFLILSANEAAEWSTGKAKPPTVAHSLTTALAGLAIWWTPVLALGFWRGFQSVLFQQGAFFGKAALVTFGGAYAVLPYVAQQAVGHFHWIVPGQMLDGLGLAETTPGPLIMVLQFVGFLAAWQHPEGLPPLVAATLGAAVTIWVTFVPCFLWIFLGAPWVEHWRGNRLLSGALAAITAAVVGVIANLAVWFAWQVFRPKLGQTDSVAMIIAGLALYALIGRKVGVIPVILGGGILGALLKLAGF